MPTKQRVQVRKGSHGGMQLVLTEDVPNLGKQGDVVEVKAGYGRNYLLPNGLATLPSEHNLRLLARYKERVRQAREARIADLKVLAEQIQRVTVTSSRPTPTKKATSTVPSAPRKSHAASRRSTSRSSRKWSVRKDRSRNAPVCRQGKPGTTTSKRKSRSWWFGNKKRSEPARAMRIVLRRSVG